jgi:Tfp pilus assembly protein PilW
MSSKYFIPAKKSQAGFSITDVMVGMVLSLIATIIIFQVFAVSESNKRNTTGGGNAQQNGVAGLFTIERGLRLAGYGFLASDPVASQVPVTLTIGGTAATPDSITVNSRPDWNYGPFDPTNNAAFPNLTPTPYVSETFSIAAAANNNVQLVSSVNGPVADGIAQLKAQYGTDANGNGIVDANEWVTGPPAVPTSVLAVRLALVARSAQAEKTVANVQCTSTTVYPSWIGGTVDLSGNLGLPAGDSWQCYRYKIFEVTVPLRNVIWRP